MAKLPKNAGTNVLVIMSDTATPISPHVTYANLDFDRIDSSGALQDLVTWLRKLGLAWNKEKIEYYLRAKQPDYRASLKWLIERCEAGFNHPDEAISNNASASSPSELRFLQAHGLRHSVISLHPVPARKERFSLCGAELRQEAPQDALDPLAWHIIVLMQKGLLRLRECKFARCDRFFEPMTPRRFYCSDLCRAKDHMKTKEEMRFYMRRRRKLLRDGVARTPRNR